jgi:hypothetical protein
MVGVGSKSEKVIAVSDREEKNVITMKADGTTMKSDVITM